MDTDYFQHRGINFASIIYSQERLEYLENEYHVFDDDVYLVTYPKSASPHYVADSEMNWGWVQDPEGDNAGSGILKVKMLTHVGTTWMMEILSLIHSNGDSTWCNKVPNYMRIPWLDVSGVGEQLVDQSESPRYLSSHLPIQLFPKSLFSSKAKVIYTARNPKDVLVSMYHYAHMSHVIKKPHGFDEFMEDFLQGRVPFGSWFDHIKGWMQMIDKENFLFVTYEDLKQDHRGTVKKICTFLGKELDEQSINLVVENSSFCRMKNNNMSNNSLVPDYIIDPKNNHFMRKGIIGDWKNHLTQKQQEYINIFYQEKMKELNVKFKWDENL